MQKFYGQQVWLYIQNDNPLLSDIVKDICKNNFLAGITYQAPNQSIFPHRGLIPVMQAAIHGEVNLLLVAADTMLGATSLQREELIKTFAGYGVSVMSCNNFGSSIS